MQFVASWFSHEPVDPLFAYISPSISNVWKYPGVIVLTFFLLLVPVLLTIRLLQDSAIALGHHSPNNHISYWMVAAPLLIITSASAVYYYHKATKLRTLASVCPLLDCLGLTMSLVAAVCKLEVTFPTHTFCISFSTAATI
jgi:small-conductance mechanosensitive channel